MRCSLLLLLSGMLTAVTPARAGEPTAAVEGSESRVPFERDGSNVLLDIQKAANAFGWEAKVVTPGKLATVCRAGDAGYCVPIRLNKVASRRTSAGLFVDADALGKALGFETVERDGNVTLKRLEKPRSTPETAGYNADRGGGRGFQVGQTLPDIPLYDMDGNEVRFSRFLGKQYIIYCWASW